MGYSLKKDFSFPKEQRLLKTKEYRASFDKGFKFLTPAFVFFAQQSVRPRLGLVVSRKVGNAVCRNKIKRLLRESYRNLTAKPDYDLVVVARSRSKSSSLSEVSKTLCWSLAKIQTLMNKAQERA